MGKKVDLTGKRFGRLVVLEEAGRGKGGAVLWRCKCNCGTEVIVYGNSLRRNNTSSCGCYRRERASSCGCNTENPKDHSRGRSRLKRTIQYHFNLIRKGFKTYSDWTIDTRYTCDGKGVNLFLQDLLNLYPEECDKYENDLSLEMDKDNSRYKVFCPEFIRFVTKRENTNNRKSTLRLNDGTPLAEFCTEIGISTRENDKITKKYNRIKASFIRQHKIHPELMSALQNDTRKQARLLYQAAMLRQEFEARVNELKEKVAKLKGQYLNKQVPVTGRSFR